MTHKVISKRSVERAYGLNGNEIIIDHATAGRLLLTDGFGGIDTLDGGAVRWKHGLVVQLKPDDTFSVIDSQLADCSYLHDWVIDGYGESRPILNWSGYAIENLAKSLDL
jgi:hypothetical protein